MQSANTFSIIYKSVTYHCIDRGIWTIILYNCFPLPLVLLNLLSSDWLVYTFLSSYWWHWSCCCPYLRKEGQGKQLHDINDQNIHYQKYLGLRRVGVMVIPRFRWWGIFISLYLLTKPRPLSPPTVFHPILSSFHSSE